MSGRIIQRPAARADLLEQYAYLAEDRVAAAERFVDAAEATFLWLAEMPNIGRRWESNHAHLQNVRVWRVKGFERWLILYRPIEDGIEILHVLHGARNLDDLLGSEGA